MIRPAYKPGEKWRAKIAIAPYYSKLFVLRIEQCIVWSSDLGFALVPVFVQSITSTGKKSGK